mgnify:CR=1 FL=1
MPFSDEILTEKSEIDQTNQEIEQLHNDLQGAGPDSFEKVLKVKKLDEKCSKLQEELSGSNLLHRTRYDSLADNKRDMENIYEENIRALQ